MCECLGVPLGKEKTEGPSSCLMFLGLHIVTVEMISVVMVAARWGYEY